MTISSTHLQINIEEQEQWRRTVSVTVPADVVKQERAMVVRRLASRMKLRGFRKGKVPTSVVENQYGPELQKETLDKVIREAYESALAEHALQPISEGEVEKVDYRPEEDLTFRISFDVRPKIEVSRLGRVQGGTSPRSGGRGRGGKCVGSAKGSERGVAARGGW